MRSLKFHLIKAKNILCFGSEGIEIDFSNFEAVNEIKGINLDAPGTHEDPASNGTGKSSIQDLMAIALYGRGVKKPTKNKGIRIVNTLADSGEVEIQWDDCRVVRSFKKTKSGVTGKLEFWKSPNRIWDNTTKMTFNPNETQAEIEKLIGLSHHAFCNVVIFDDSNIYSFLEADTPTKREIVENLLDLEQYRGYHETCKSLLKEIKKQVDTKSHEYNRCKSELDVCEKRIQSIKSQETIWKTNKQNELNALSIRLQQKQKQLESTDMGNQMIVWQNAQEKITVLNTQILEAEPKVQKFNEAVKTAKQKIELVKNELSELNLKEVGLRTQLQSISIEINKQNKIINDLKSLKTGTKCQVCLSEIDPSNFNHVVTNAENSIKESMDTKLNVDKEQLEILALIKTKKEQIVLMESKVNEAVIKTTQLENNVLKLKNELNSLLRISKPEVGMSEKILEIEIKDLNDQICAKKLELDGVSPYNQMLVQTEQELSVKNTETLNKASELQSLESEIPYYEFWSEAFGDNGIRKFVIDGIIPALNERIAYWLQILIDGLIELKFDNKLEETITRKGNPAFYSNLSNGEVQRVNLAVSQSFAYVMMLNSGCCPNIVFLDEITGGGIDKAGIPYVYNMIIELAKERQVFVTTHNEALMSLLHGCKTLSLKKENDVTTLIS